MSPPGYQAPVVKASRCGNEEQEWSDRRKAGKEGSGKKKPDQLNCLADSDQGLGLGTVEGQQMYPSGEEHAFRSRGSVFYNLARCCALFFPLYVPVLHHKQVRYRGVTQVIFLENAKRDVDS